MKIDSQNNLSVASKQATSKKSQIESPSASSFDDVLKGTKLRDRPKLGKVDDKPEVGTKKPTSAAKKTSGQKKHADQNDESPNLDESVEQAAVERAKTKTSDDRKNESETAIDSETDAPVEEEKPAEVVAKTDSADISNLAQAAALVQTTDAPPSSESTSEQAVEVEGSTGNVAAVKATAAKPGTGQTEAVAPGDTVESVIQPDQAQSVEASTTPLADPTVEEGGVEVDPQNAKKPTDAKTTDEKAAADAAAQATAANEKAAQTLDQIQSHSGPHTQVAAHQPTVKAPEAPQQPLTGSPDVRFAQDNHPQIVSGIRGELLPNGGSMTLKLDPPELGALQVQLHMRDGTMTATFQTSNDDATRMLSHSLSSLKSSLEAQGINVDKLQVQQAPKEQQTGTNQDHREQGQGAFDNQSARQEQQRKEMLQRMWRKLSGVEDPLDMVA